MPWLTLGNPIKRSFRKGGKFVKLLHPLIPPGRRVRAAAVALTVAAVSLIGLSPVAQAATAAVPLAAASSFAGATGHTFVVHRPATAPYVSTISYGNNSCTILVDSVSTVAGGDLGGDGSISCTYNVYAIVLLVELFNGTTQESSTPEDVVYTSAFTSDTSYAAFNHGSWQTAAVADIYWTSPSSYMQVGPVASVPNSE
jgi:hypothetical protein